MTEGIVIAAEGAQVCELCGKSAETRPYGPNGEEVCFDCAMQDEAAAKAAAKAAFDKRLRGEA